MKPSILTYISFFAVLLIVACAPIAPTGSPTGAVVTQPPVTQTAEPSTIEPMDSEPVPVEEETLSPHNPFTIEAVEGDLITLSPEAVDPDGDRIIYTFGKPFDNRGEWQTAIGDEGTYEVAVGAGDGKSTTTETILVVVHRANRAPIIDCDPIVVREGETVDLHEACTVTDEDDTEVVVTYSGWMSGARKDVGFNDAGEHTVTITASDRRKDQILHTVAKEVKINVENVNRQPTFGDAFPEIITATENDIVALPKESIADPDGDSVRVTYSEPFDSEGIWRTKIGDAGSYSVDIVASDGLLTTKRTVIIKLGLRNTPPTLRDIQNITVEEGETVTLPISATDREGDPLTTVISGWMTSQTKQTGFDDAGVYTVKVSVTDGVFTASQIVHVTVKDKNRPPVFVSPA